MAGLGSGGRLGLYPSLGAGAGSGPGHPISATGLTQSSSLMLRCGVVVWLMLGEHCENKEAVFGLSEPISDTDAGRREVRWCAS